jgi:hypothetical protein
VKKPLAPLGILLRDWPSLGFVAFTALWLLPWTVGLGFAAAGGSAEGLRTLLELGGGLALASAVFGAVAAWRVRLISRLLQHGARLSGRVLARGENSEDIRHAVVAYTLSGRAYRALITVEGAPRHFDPLPGDDVAIVVDPRRPTRAFFLAMFVDTNGGND